MSLIGLLTAVEKQVPLGCFHMRPIQWHLKNNWHLPESLEKVIPIPRSLHNHLHCWLEEACVLQGQPLHPLQHALQIFTDTSNKGWGAHLENYTAQGVWSIPESNLHIKFLDLKAVLLSLKKFEHLWRYEIRLSLCPPLEIPILVQSETICPTSPSHSMPPQCDSRQVIMTQTNDPDGVISASGSV